MGILVVCSQVMEIEMPGIDYWSDTPNLIHLGAILPHNGPHKGVHSKTETQKQRANQGIVVSVASCERMMSGEAGKEWTQDGVEDGSHCGGDGAEVGHRISGEVGG
jgi:hypothetical protein